MVAPNIGWSNAIPDAVGDVDFVVNGEAFNFHGSAYHDHVGFHCSFHALTNLHCRIGAPSHSKTTFFANIGGEAVLESIQSYGPRLQLLMARTTLQYTSPPIRRS
jgi:hypothetical protein